MPDQLAGPEYDPANYPPETARMDLSIEEICLELAVLKSAVADLVLVVTELKRRTDEND